MKKINEFSSKCELISQRITNKNLDYHQATRCKYLDFSGETQGSQEKKILHNQLAHHLSIQIAKNNNIEDLKYSILSFLRLIRLLGINILPTTLPSSPESPSATHSYKRVSNADCICRWILVCHHLYLALVYLWDQI